MHTEETPIVIMTLIIIMVESIENCLQDKLRKCMEDRLKITLLDREKNIIAMMINFSL
ncbi:hypothetical protein [Elizabethkingia miricola]|uniref:hypothetical protein n=1 Tax=Elizabethkingia miricola TaxID=172045 RepID=UPI00162AE856